MQIDGYTYRECGTCGEPYYIHEDETECKSCRSDPQASGSRESDVAETDGESTDSADDDGRNGDDGTSSAIAMIKRVNRGGGDDGE